MSTEAQRDIARHGQVFTPPAIVDAMLALRRNRARVLEPACGDGAFSTRLPGCTAIELDPTHCPAGALNIDFFAYPETEKFDTIIGNPPYVKARDILPGTRRHLGAQLLNGHAAAQLPDRSRNRYCASPPRESHRVCPDAPRLARPRWFHSSDL